MLNKLYDKIKEMICKNYKLLLLFFITLFTLTFQLPFYINSPGGIIDISEKIEIEDSAEVKGSFNFAYVTELKATIPTLLIAYFNDDWDILEKKEVVYGNESNDDVSFRNHLLLEESTQTAIILAYTRAQKEIKVVDEQLFITYVDLLSESDLKVGDRIIEVEGKKIATKEEFNNILSGFDIGQRVNIKVENDNKISNKYATLFKNDGKKIIGIMLCQRKELITSPKIKLHFDASESGPSGGLMMSLAIYNYLTNEDITHGQRIVGTGTIDGDGNVGSIGGIEYKLKGVVKQNVKTFLVPAGENYEEAIKIKEKEKYKIEIVPISTFDEAIAYLEELDNN